MARSSNYALRLQRSLKEAAQRLAEAEGTTLNQFINVAVAEKIAALTTADSLRQRAARADPEAFARVMARVGDGAPEAGDELPADWDEARDMPPSARQ